VLRVAAKIIIFLQLASEAGSRKIWQAVEVGKAALQLHTNSHTMALFSEKMRAAKSE
jgi:hypothetical protein